MAAVFSTLTTGLAGCQSTGCDGDALGQDQIRLLDSLQEGDKTWHLYTRTTGFQDKAVFFELYDAAPVFDQCERASIEPVYQIDYNDYPDKQHVKTITLQSDETEKLSIVYTKDQNEGFTDVHSVKFSR